jgi:hypothetical protein
MDCFPVETRHDRYTLVVPLNTVYLYLGVCIPSPRGMDDSLIAGNRSLHLNVPGANDSSGTIIRRKLTYCLAAAIAPELIVLWAASECIKAWWHSTEMRIRGHDYWTATHSFVAAMGGIVAEDSHERVLVEEVGKIDKARLSWLSLKVIRDKSKSSNIAKTIACFQVGWLIAQSTGRRIQGLPITLLEVATIAYAANCFLIYGLWWKKPLDIAVPFKVAAEGIRTSPTRASEIATYQLPSWVFTNVEEHIKQTKFGALKVRALHSHVIRSEADVTLAAASTAMFGAIHLAGWNSDFASPIEKILWRTCSSLATGLPLILLLMVSVSPYISAIFLLIPAVPYILCRIYLMVEPFVNLRSLPAGSYDTVQWASFIPHI